MRLINLGVYKVTLFCELHKYQLIYFMKLQILVDMSVMIYTWK
uniref:Uncharacterized protein n=1 Tax=Rhizophora mucronata TaxID=61149 RepID=A0A2P2P3S6_RHIMU